MKQIFIGSSSESIRYAEAIQANINGARMKNLQAICWHQGVFNIGHSALEDLLMQLENSDFGVFVFAKDDYVNTREENVYCARDNVVFEMGLFLGTLGRERVFCLIPDDSKYHIPSDLQGIYYTRYKETEENISLAVGAACTQIKETIRKTTNTSANQIQINKKGLFPSFDGCYHDFFSNSCHITTYFVHSRKWRENNLIEIDEFLKRDDAKWDVVLPDIFDDALLSAMKKHFDDGENILDKILDSYRFFNSYRTQYPEKIIVHSFSLYPTYSFYKFDNNIIVSMYPLTSKRHPTPTFLLSLEDESNKFFQTDVNCLIEKTKIIMEDEMQKIINFKC